MSSNGITEKIEQLVFDENKIVTYKLLSSELSVHVNKAKQLLNEYFTNHCAKRKKDLNVYYAVSGFQKYNGHQIHKLTVISEDELEKIKKKFNSLSSIHIYSIQKGSSLDEYSLYTSDYILTKASDDPSLFSAIRHPNRKIRENRIARNAESSVTKEKSKIQERQAIKKTESSVSAKKTNSLFTSWQKKDDLKNEQNSKTVKEQNEASPNEKNGSSLAEKKNSKSPQKGAKMAEKGKNSIMNLFSKQAVKSTLKVNMPTSDKLTVPNSVLCENEEKEKSVKRTEVEEEEVKTAQVKAKQVEATSKNKKIVSKKGQKHQRSCNNSENDSDDDWKKPKKKKHKRIVTAFSDSESESEEEEKKDRAQRDLMDSKSPAKVESNGIEEDEEDPIPPTPPVPVTYEKRKKLKFVSKTFEDEEGFLVTQKVKEYVSDSEDSETEGANKAKIAPKDPPKPNIKHNFVNKKQASLMSFFKQK